MLPKLVRNFIPKIIAQNKNRIPQFYQANENEYWEKLKEKLIEEAHEFITSEDISELADILEIIEAIVIFKKTSLEKLNTIKKDKAQSHGTFSDRIILLSIKES